MEYDYKILEEKFKKLPGHIQAILTSPEIAKTVKEIGDRHGLMIDQESVLFDQITYVMLGLNSPNDFTNNLGREANISKEEAVKISGDISKEIFSQLKSVMEPETFPRNGKEITHVSETPATTISSIEHVGGFSIEKESPEASKPDDVTPLDRERLLNNLENPTRKGAAPANLPTDDGDKKAGNVVSGSSPAENHNEPLVDLLLSKPAAQPEKRVDVAQKSVPAPSQDKKPVQTPKTDPYREPIN